MINSSDIEARKNDKYDTENDRGHGKIYDNISEEYRNAQIAKEGIISEEELEPQNCKGSGKGNALRLHQAGTPHSIKS
ncbi:hypothetical protein D1007_02129 [Hordeum vulgare]|nr:hypothetical protein D1007_02129 [Hordeum vulgare]